MIVRDLHPDLNTSLMNNDPFIYFHLVKFERPKPSSGDGSVENLATDYAYITDAPYNIEYDDADKTSLGVSHGLQTYNANKLISIGTVQESTEARATTISLKLSSNALSTTAITIVSNVGSGLFISSANLVSAGFSEGDKVYAGNGTFIRLNKFGTYVSYTLIDGPDLTSATYTFTLVSEEINALTVDQLNNPLYANYVNRIVYIYKAHARPETGEIIGVPFLLFKGIIAEGAIQDDAESDSTISWGLSSHWGDFVRVQGRLTSDSAHRALDMTGKSDPEALIRPEYAFDYGFAHSESSINVLANYQSKEKRFKMVKKGGLAGWLGGKKVKEYYETVNNEVDLRFNLAARYLPVVYGVQKVSGIPVFTDVDATPTPTGLDVYVAYAICEGPIGGIYDIHIDDNPTVCSDLPDSDARGVEVTDNPDVVCYGRADYGFVLQGQAAYIEVQTTRSAPVREGEDLTINVIGGYYIEPRDSTPPNLQISEPGYDGITHETTWTFRDNSIIPATFVLHSGKDDQRADYTLLNMAAKKDFKIQNDYYVGAKENYWGSAHTLLDTAYVSCIFSTTKEQNTIPSYNYVVKGKYLDCYNYDHSFKILSGSPAPFNLGDLVTISTLNNADATTVRHTDVPIIDKWIFYGEDGIQDVRFRFGTNWPEANDTLINLGTDTRIAVAKGLDGMILATYDYKTPSATVATATPLAIVEDVTESNAEVALDEFLQPITVPSIAIETDGALNTLFEYYGNGLYITLTTIPQYSFKVLYYTTNIIHIETNDLTYELFINNDRTGNNLFISNLVNLPSITNINPGSEIIFSRIVDNKIINTSRIVETGIAPEGSPVAITTYIPFDPSFVPGRDAYTGAGIAGDTYATQIGSDRRVSINPAIQLLDYISSNRYGRGLDIIEDINLSTFQASARLCDDQSKVTVVTTTAAVINAPPTPLAIYTFNAGGVLKFQGKAISSVERAPGIYETTFDYVIGKLGHKWTNWRKDWITGDLVWKDGLAYIVPINYTGVAAISEATIDGWTPISSFNLTSSGNPSLTVNVTRSTGVLNGVTGSNPIVRAWSDADGSFSLPGYSLYDSDHVKYWKYLGWDGPEQRYVTRHQMNQVIDTSVPIFDNINSMLNQFNGILRYSNGQYELDIKTGMARDDYIDGVDRISEADIIGSIKLDDKGQKGSYNSITTNIVDPQNKFEARSLSFLNSDYLKQDKGVVKQGNYSLPGITNYYNARLNIVQYLNESRYGLTVTFKMDPKGYRLLAGKTILINYARFGWIDRPFRVQTLDLEPAGLVIVTAKEHNDATYLIEYSDRTPMDNTELGPIGTTGTIVSPVTSLTAITEFDGGHVTLTWVHPNMYNSDYEVNVYASEALYNGELSDEEDALTYPNPLAGPDDDIYDIGTKYARLADTYDFMNRGYSTAKLIGSSVGDSYSHDTILFNNEHFKVYFYWVEVVRKSIGTFKRRVSTVFPSIVEDPVPSGVMGINRAFTPEIVIINSNPEHTLPVTFENEIIYTGSGLELSLYEKDPDIAGGTLHPLRYAGYAVSGPTPIITPNSWQIDSIDIPDTNIEEPNLTDLTLGSITRPDSDNPLNPDNDMASIEDWSALQANIDLVTVIFNISGMKEDGSVFNTAATQIITRGIPGAVGVILESDVNQIIYDNTGFNPVPNQVHLTALAYNIDNTLTTEITEIARYKFTDITNGGNIVIKDDVDDWSLSPTVTYEVSTEYDDIFPHRTIKVEVADATEYPNLTIPPGATLATDTIVIYSHKMHSIIGLDAISVFNSNPSHTIVHPNYGGSGTFIAIYEGNTALTFMDTYPGVALTPGTFGIQSIDTIPAESITVGIPIVDASGVIIQDHSAMDEVANILIIYTIDVKREDGTLMNDILVTQSIDRKTQAVHLEIDVLGIKYDSNWENPSPSSININTRQENFTEPEYRFELLRANEQTRYFPEPGPATWSTTNFWSPSVVVDDPANAQYEIQVKVYAQDKPGEGIGADDDTVIIPVLKEGASAITGWLTNPRHTAPIIILDPPVNGTGTAYELTEATGTFRVFEGTTELTNTARVTYSITTTNPKDGVTLILDTNTGIYSVALQGGVGPWTSGAGTDWAVNWILRATVDNTYQIDQYFILIKSYAGKSVSLTASSQYFTYDKDNILYGDDKIVFRAVKQDTDMILRWNVQYLLDELNELTWTNVANYDDYLTGEVIDGNTSQITLTNTNFEQFIFDTTTSAMRVWAYFVDPDPQLGIPDETEIFYIDTITINKLKDGADGTNGSNGSNAAVVKLTAPSYVVTYDQNGNNPNPATSMVLTATAQGVLNGWFRFTGTGINPAEPNFTDGIGVLNDTANWDVPTTYTGFGSPRTLRVGVADGDTTELAYDTITITPIRSGIDGYTIVQSNPAHSIPSDSSGTILAGGYAGSGTTFKVYVGGTAYVPEIGVLTVNSNEFKITNRTVSPGLTITLGNISENLGDSELVVADFSAWTSGENVAYVDYTIQFYVDNSLKSVVIRQTLTKSLSGLEGVTYALTNPNPMILVDKEGYGPRLFDLGTVMRLEYSSGTFEIKRGGTSLAGTGVFIQSGWTLDGSYYKSTTDGVTVWIHKDTGAYYATVPDTSTAYKAWTSDTIIKTLTATVDSVVYSVTYTLTKAYGTQSNCARTWNYISTINGDISGSAGGAGIRYKTDDDVDRTTDAGAWIWAGPLFPSWIINGVNSDYSIIAEHLGGIEPTGGDATGVIHAMTSNRTFLLDSVGSSVIKVSLLRTSNNNILSTSTYSLTAIA